MQSIDVPAPRTMPAGLRELCGMVLRYGVKPEIVLY